MKVRLRFLQKHTIFYIYFYNLVHSQWRVSVTAYFRIHLSNLIPSTIAFWSEPSTVPTSRSLRRSVRRTSVSIREICLVALTLINFAVFFGHLAAVVEDIRYQHAYHPVPVEQKSPALVVVLNEISSGRFGDAHVYEPYVDVMRSGIGRCNVKHVLHSVASSTPSGRAIIT